MSKRGAQSELNDRNWDDEEEAEEAGIFEHADESVLKDRQFIKGRRRVTPGTGPTAVSASVFSGFQGFSSKPGGCNTRESSIWSDFGANPVSMAEDKTENAYSSSKSSVTVRSDDTSSVSSKSSVSMEGETDTVYLQNLKKLNEGFLSWIKMHIEKNPYVVFTPVLQDYSAHIQTIEKDLQKRKSGQKNENGSKSDMKGREKDRSSETGNESAGVPWTIAANSHDSTGILGNSNSVASSQLTGAAPVAPPSLFSGFTFNKQMPPVTSTFTFAASAPPASISNVVKDSEEEEYEPPKEEVREIVEEGSVYSGRCKLFYQKDGAWKERGVGNIHIKPLEGGKSQLLVRADNNLGTILLNVMLSSSMPVKKQGKNNIFFACIPNPKIDSNTANSLVSMLVRVKTENEADQLLAKIQEVISD